MDRIQHLEYEYLKAKIAYYEGNPLMTDVAFDHIEKELKEAGSKVVEQVGSKRKDFDFTHPTRMLSLSKLQTEQNNGVTNYQTEEFLKWYNKRIEQIGHEVYLYSSPKYDGNGINIIYKGTKLLQVLTRGDGTTGKDVSERFKPVIPQEIKLVGMNGMIDDIIFEIRCEVVIDVNIFKAKYSQFANPRNFVAGVIGRDEFEPDAVKDLTIKPLHFIMNGLHISRIHFSEEPFYFNSDEHMITDMRNYEVEIQSYEQMREKFAYQLDGVVFSFPIEYRKKLGENDHDPEWAIAIKFVPDEVVTSVESIEWNVGKTGELTPVVLLKPVQLAGTIVKRASGYNAGYVVNNKLGEGAVVSIAKAGDIIPEIQSVQLSGKSCVLPNICPACKAELDFDGIHLTCNNEDCLGKRVKKLAYGAALLDLKGIGGKTIEPFAKDYKNIYELMYSVLNPSPECSIDYESYGIKVGSRTHEIFYDAFKNIKSLPYETVIVMLGYDNVGRKLSTQIAREHCGLVPDFTSMDRSLVAKLHEPEVVKYIKQAVMNLESLGVTIDRPKEDKKNEGAVYVCLTGSPKAFGYKTKEEFMAKFPELIEVSLTDKTCNYLITDSYSSTSSKMEVAKKKGIAIKTYGDYK